MSSSTLVVGVSQIIISVLAIGLSQAELSDMIESKVLDSIAKMIPFEQIERLEKTVLKLQSQVILQEKRIKYWENSDRKQSRLIHSLMSEVNGLKELLELKKKCPDEVITTPASIEAVAGSSEKETLNITDNNTKNNTNQPPDNIKKRPSKTEVQAERNTFKRGQDEPVAFSAYLGEYIEHLGPGSIVKCNNIILNRGNAYAGSSGVFTAPSDGVYMFDYHFDSSRHTVLALFIDGVNQLDAVTFPSTQKEGMGGNLVLVQLKIGQEVWLEGRIITDGVVIGDNSFRYTTFSGVLLF